MDRVICILEIEFSDLISQKQILNDNGNYDAEES